ncbi:MAG: ferric reductase-like transmembrane domain-containing protein [Propionibacteriales bacterium]|nr:ferric reductase-like transmembrane domain-containing protein [Propionibacteriales bacterium]
MNESPLLWILNRSTGISLLLVLSLSVALGVLTLRGRAAGDGGARLPRFVTQALHRNLALGAMALLLAHAVTAVADEYVDIRWWHALVPWGGTYEPVWLALGTLSMDLMIAVAVTSALRGRIGQRPWKLVHLSSWLAWLAGVVHGVMIGTDLSSPDRWVSWSVVPTALSIAVVVLAFGYRVIARPHPIPPKAPAAPGRSLDSVGERR